MWPERNDRAVTALSQPSMFDPQVIAPRTNWWLRATSFGWNRHLPNLEARERMRHSRLLSWLLLGIFIVILLLTPLGLSDPGTLFSEVVVAVAAVVALLLNRGGQVVWGGLLVVVITCAAIMSSLVSFPLGLTVDSLPVYDLLVIPVVVAATVLPQPATFAVAALNTALICVDFSVQQHAANLDAVINDVRLYPTPQIAVVSLLARPIALQVITALVAFLWVRGADAAIRRADRAEEVALLEHQIADQKRQLDVGIQQILQTHVRAANGDFGARAPQMPGSALWQIASSLNNLLGRLQRAGTAEFRLQRTEEELGRLAAALRDAQAGRRPLWPAPSNTGVDTIIEIIAGPQRPGLPPQPPYPPQSGTSGGGNWPY